MYRIHVSVLLLIILTNICLISILVDNQYNDIESIIFPILGERTIGHVVVVRPIDSALSERP